MCQNSHISKVLTENKSGKHFSVLTDTRRSWLAIYFFLINRLVRTTQYFKWVAKVLAHSAVLSRAPGFENVYGAQESIPPAYMG
jgi:hypothetical protein